MSCETCGVPYEEEEYHCPIRSKKVLFFFKRTPKISQSFHKGTHIKTLSHAIDFEVPVKTKVFAARKGVVVDLANHFERGGSDDALRHKANFVCIRHDDGNRYSRYYHLKSVVVKVGQEVEVGTLLGYSGNTGYTFGPHLHFDIVDLHAKDMINLRFVENGNVTKIPCVPFTFSLSNLPKEGIVLPLYYPTPVDLGADIKLSDIEFPKQFAIICRRGGVPSFREKAERAAKLGASCLIVVDNDITMKESLPLLVGDAAEMVSIFAVFISSIHLELLARNSRSDQGLSASSICIEFSASDFYKPRSNPCELSEQALPFCKPITLPVNLRAMIAS